VESWEFKYQKMHHLSMPFTDDAKNATRVMPFFPGFYPVFFTAYGIFPVTPF